MMKLFIQASFFAIIVTCLLVVPLANGHEINGHKHAEASTTSPPAVMQLPTIEGPKPWSDKPLLNDPHRFQIAIVSDRTGGHRPGVWMDAVRKLNRLRPEFVVSVGDLIEGYSTDTNRLNREWSEFLGFIDELEMRFFFVAGNHDVTNPVMHKMWRERFGREWYSFDYKEVHFLCLCSEDPVNHLGEKQLEFIHKDLAAHRDARWTLVFIHKPLWIYAEKQIAKDGKDKTNWKQVEQLLVDRPHTVFSGHVHQYVQYKRNGQEYYALATTGGGSKLRGNEYGEFDHITWLTMEPTGPQIVNLRLDGILPPDVVTEQSIKRMRNYLRQVAVEVSPILVESNAGFDEGTFEVRLTSKFPEAIELTGTIGGLPLRGLTVDPEQFKLAVGPKGKAQQSVLIRFAEPIEFSSLRRATFTAQLRSPAIEGENLPRLLIEKEIPILIDRRYGCPLLAKRIEIDGHFRPMPKQWYTTPKIPLVLGEADDWKGPTDGSFALSASHHGEVVFFSIRITDERVLADADQLDLVLDARQAKQRLDSPQFHGGITHVTLSPPDKTGELKATAVTHHNGSRVVEQTIEAAAVRTVEGWDVEIALPTTALNPFQKEGWKDFQLSVIYRDVDEAGAKPADIVWRGSREVEKRNTNYAQFVRAE